MLALTSSPVENAAMGIVLLAAVVTALGLLFRKVYRAFKMGELAFVNIIGTTDQPSLREQLDTVKEIALRSERELHPNGGSSLRDDVRAGLSGAQEAKVRAAEAALRAEATATALAAMGESAAHERAQIRDAMLVMRSEIAEDAAQRYADALDLLAEHGGPDLRPHIDPGNVIPHVHVLPDHSADKTSGPVEP